MIGKFLEAFIFFTTFRCLDFFREQKISDKNGQNAEVLEDLDFGPRKKKFPKKNFFFEKNFFLVFAIQMSRESGFGVRVTIWWFLGPTHSVLGVF